MVCIVSYRNRGRTRLVVYCSLLLGAGGFIAASWLGGSSHRLVVSLHSNQHPIRDIDFPAVGLCSPNIVSKKAARKYARYILSKDEHQIYSEEYVYNSILHYGALLNFDDRTLDIEFTQYMKRVGEPYNVSQIMRQLSPTCERLLVRCSWRGLIRNCSELFAQRVTPSGYCCIFNYNQDSNDMPQLLDIIGQDNGLSVLVSEDYDDYGYTVRRTIGIEVLLFSPREYPLREGGGVRSYWLLPNVTSYIALAVAKESATAATRRYSTDIRKCRFPDERQPPTGAATYTSCLTACRRRSMLQLCNCVPYFLPRRSDDPECTPNHLTCLNKHRELFLYHYPRRSVLTAEHEVGLREELQNSISCEECVPDCESTRYRGRLYFSRYDDGVRMLQNYFSHGLELKNRSILQVFYNTEDQMLYTMDVTQEWCEMLGSLGGAWSALVAGPLISVAELLYYFTVRWHRNYTVCRRFVYRRHLNDK